MNTYFQKISDHLDRLATNSINVFNQETDTLIYSGLTATDIYKEFQSLVGLFTSVRDQGTSVVYVERVSENGNEGKALVFRLATENKPKQTVREEQPQRAITPSALYGVPQNIGSNMIPQDYAEVKKQLYISEGKVTSLEMQLSTVKNHLTELKLDSISKLDTCKKEAEFKIKELKSEYSELKTEYKTIYKELTILKGDLSIFERKKELELLEVKNSQKGFLDTDAGKIAIEQIGGLAGAFMESKANKPTPEALNGANELAGLSEKKQQIIEAIKGDDVTDLMVENMYYTLFAYQQNKTDFITSFEENKLALQN